MRYVTILIVIVFYWFILSIGLFYLVQDEFIIAEAIEGNTSYNLINSSNINVTTDEITEQTTLRTFPTMLRIMFGFKSPIPQGIPSIITVFLSFLNWFLLVFAGISLYRILNPLA